MIGRRTMNERLDDEVRPDPPPFVVRARLFAEPLLVEEADGSAREVEHPVLSVCFDYDGVLVRATDRDEHGRRDLAAEARALRMLESFGAVEIGYIDDAVPPVDSSADYLVVAQGNVHSWCSFTAYALPRLRSAGWQIDVDPDYPYRLVEAEPEWVATVDADDEQGDWFTLELGVDIGGRRVSLLPALLELIDGAPDHGSLDSLLRMPARYRALPTGRGTFIAIEPGRLHALIQVLLELYRGEKYVSRERLRFARPQAGSLPRLRHAVGHPAQGWRWEGQGAELCADAVLLEIGYSPNQASLEQLQAELRRYQRDGLGWLQQLRAQGLGGILADDMGLGKTLQTIAHLLIEHRAGRAEQPSLVVMPKSLVGNWQRELGRFAPCLRVGVLHGPRRHRDRADLFDKDVVLTTYPVLVKDAEWLAALRFHLVILDEAQNIKNPRSQAARAASALRGAHRLCLTGTPVENNLEELWSLFRFLMPDLLGDADHFTRHIRYPIERDGSEQRLEALRGRVGPYILRRIKEHVARDLPPKTEIVRPVELEGPQRDLYETIRVAAHADVRRMIHKKGLSASTITLLDALLKLRQVCCDPRLVRVPSARRVTGSAKFDALFSLLDRQLGQGRAVLLFSQFTQMLALIGAGLRERGLPYVELTGASHDRQKPVDDFQSGGASLFLISLKAGGTGLNLTRADTVIHYDPWWNAAAQAQATDRAYRIGQTKPVFVYKLIVSGSVEERMLMLQERKQRLADTLLGAGGGRLSADEIEDLFAPLSD